MEKVLLIINPVAGKKKIDGIRNKLTDILNKKANTVDVVHTEYSGNAISLASEAKSKGYDTVIACGGDGTLNEIFTGILSAGINNDLKVGYIPCGSTNDFAETLELSSNPLIQAENISNENITPLDVGKFGEDRYFSYIASFGALTDASYSAPQKLKNRVGHFAYILEGIKDFFKIRPTRAKILANGNEYSGDFVFGSCSNTLSVGGIVRLSRDLVNIHDGLFEVLLVKYPRNIIQLIRILTGALKSDFSSEMFEFFRAKEIEMIFDKDTDFTLDGEKATAYGSVKIVNLERAINLCK